MKPINTLGALGSYNLRQETFADAMAISGEEMHAHYPRQGHDVSEVPGGLRQAVRDPRRRAGRASRPRCRSTRRSSPSGPCSATRTRRSLARANDLCDLLGMDTITHGRDAGLRVRGARARLAHRARGRACPSAGATGAACCALVEMTAAREGFGDRLAEGAWRLAESRPRRGHARRLRGEAPRAARPLGARAQGHVHRLRDGHAAGAATTTRARRRSTRRATIGAAPRASPSSRCGASTSPRGRLARALPLHLRARLRPLHRGALRAHGAAPSPAGT